MSIALDVIWEQFLQLAREEVGSSTVETWFKAVSFFEWDAIKKTVYLIAPNVFVKNWLHNNYTPLFVTHLGRLLHTVDVLIVIYTNQQEALVNKKNDQQAIVVAPALKAKERFTPASIASSPATSSSVIKKLDNSERIVSLNALYQFDNFIIGPSNEFACAAAQAVTDNLGRLYNPLFIYGKSGLGKTHLLHAIGNRLHTKNKIILYQTADRFVSEFISAIRLNQMHKFQKKYQYVDVLLVDDIQFMAHKEQTQEAFFHLFNTLYDAHKQIVFTCDAYPHALEGIADRLKSRLASGLIADIKEPQLETKIAIIKKKMESHNVLLDDELIQFLAMHAGESIRELQGLLTRLLASASLTNVPISLELAQQICLRHSSDTFVRTDFDILTIIKSVAKYYSYSQDAICSKDREKYLVRARHVAMFLIKQLTKKSLREIAFFFDSKSHATIKHAVCSIEKALKKDAILQKQIHDLQVNLGKKN